MKKEINEAQLAQIIYESVKRALMENDTNETDRHRDGYYDDYAKKTGKKDRHSPGYYKKYNKEHPERLNRGFTKGYVNGNVDDGKTAHGNHSLEYQLRRKELEWHDDDWEESVD